LMSDRLDRLPEAIGAARRARSIMRVNVVASLVVKGVFVLLAPFGLVTLVLAVAADMGMSLLVTLNALRLLRSAPRHKAPTTTGRAHRPGAAERDDGDDESGAIAPVHAVVVAAPADSECSDGCCSARADPGGPLRS
jgi:hypothetical protein